MSLRDLLPESPEYAWMKDAACRGQPNLMFPEAHDIQGVRRAVAICKECPCRLPCAKLGMDEDFGIWGGLTARRRRILRHYRRRRGRPLREADYDIEWSNV